MSFLSETLSRLGQIDPLKESARGVVSGFKSIFQTLKKPREITRRFIDQPIERKLTSIGITPKEIEVAKTLGYSAAAFVSPLKFVKGYKAIQSALQSGKDVAKAFSNKDIGAIDAVVGEAGKYGLAKIKATHPEVLPFLDDAIKTGKVVERLPNLDILEAKTPLGVLRVLIDKQLGTTAGVVKKTFVNNAYIKVPRGGVEPPTPAFSKLRSTVELPRRAGTLAQPSIDVNKIIPRRAPAIERLAEAIRKAKPARKEQEALYAAERARRTARVAEVGERVKGEKGLFAQLGQLKGPLPKARFEPIRPQFTQQDVDELFDTIQKAPNLLPLEKVTGKVALKNIFEGSVLTRNEIDLLSEVFPRNLIVEILKKRPTSQRVFEAIGKAINLPRAVMATVDLSAPLRQGVFLVGRPKQFVPAFLKMFKFAASEKAYQGYVDDLIKRPNYLKMKEAGLSFTDIGSSLAKREELFMSNWAEKIPGFGILARASNRAYTGFLNKLRADVFDDILTRQRAIGRQLSDVELKGIGRFVNSATGRGDLPNVLATSAPLLNAAFFSPRLMASRLNLLNPLFYTNLPPIARKEALKSLFSFAGITGTILTLADLNPAVEIGKDPRSADFLKIKVGNKRYDILGGFQQYMRLAGQLISGEMVSSTTGRTITLGEGFGTPSRLDIALRFFEYKTSPIASFIIALAKGESSVGKDVDIPAEIINRFIPMVVQDLYDLSQEEGTKNIMLGVPAIFGVGVQTYGKQELVFGKSKIGEPTAQVRPVQELAEKIREKFFGQLPLGTSKGFSIETYYDQLSSLPRDQAAEIFDQIQGINPELAKKIRNVVKEREIGITAKDKDLKALGVASGDRATAVLENLNKLKTKEEKARLWDEYVKKGIITKEVARQLKALLKQ